MMDADIITIVKIIAFGMLEIFILLLIVEYVVSRPQKTRVDNQESDADFFNRVANRTVGEMYEQENFREFLNRGDYGR